MIHPLKGMRIVEIASYGTGPYCGMLLADMGATVIKIEEPNTGDPLRSWPPKFERTSAGFMALNRNKKSVAIDIKSEAGRKSVLELIRDADVIIQNFRPGVLARYGLDFESIRQVNDSIVYCSISAYGQDGPRSQEGGFDLTLQALSGLMSVTGSEDGPPAKCGVPIVDFATGLFAAFSIASYAPTAKAAKKAVHLDVSMLGVSLSIAALQTAQTLTTNTVPTRLGSRHPNNSPYQAYSASDGYIAIAAGNDKLWTKTCEALQCLHLLHEPRFSSVENRAKNQNELAPLIEACLKQQPKSYWLELLSVQGVPCAPVNNFLEALEDIQVKHMAWVSKMVNVGSEAETPVLGPILKVNGKQQIIYHPAPTLGEHNGFSFPR